MVGYQGEVS